MDGRTYGHTDGHLRPALLGRLCSLAMDEWHDVVYFMDPCYNVTYIG